MLVLGEPPAFPSPTPTPSASHARTRSTFRPVVCSFEQELLALEKSEDGRFRVLDDFTVNLSFATRTHQRKKAWELLPHTFANILPGLAALVVALFLSVLLAWILATIVRRILAGLHFDERLGRWGFASSADWLPMNSPTRLVSRSIAALVIVSGFLIGISAFDFQWTSLFVQNVFAYIPAVMAALVVLLFGNVVARFLARSVLIQYARFLSIGVKWIVIVLSVARPTASQSRGLMKAGADGARQR